MPTIHSKYLGQLRVEATHVNSQVKLVTDAPLDNNGLGRSFSPTDLVCAALGNCMITLMGMVAERENIDLTSVTFETTKIMASHPRKISEIHIDFNMKKVILTEPQQKKLENAAKTCPVSLSLDPAIKQIVRFEYDMLKN